MTETKEKEFPEVDQKMKEEIIDTHKKLEALSNGHTLRQQRLFHREKQSKWGKKYFGSKEHFNDIANGRD